MAEYTYEGLESMLKAKLGDDMPERAMEDIHEALKITEKMETEGYKFKLEDLSRGSLTETDWRATLSKDGREFAGQSDHAALAVCVAVADALEDQADAVFFRSRFDAETVGTKVPAVLFFLKANCHFLPSGLLLEVRFSFRSRDKHYTESRDYEEFS